MIEVPDFIHKYFWDIPINNLSLDKHYKYIIERILEIGDETAINWMNQQFSVDQIKAVLIKSKRISTKTGIFYAKIYGVNEHKLECIQKPFTQKQNRF